jgi:hypothetical protein
MKRKRSTSNKKKRITYVSPKLKLIMLQMEQDIAAGSAAVVSSNTNGQVLETWETGTDREGDIPW